MSIIPRIKILYGKDSPTRDDEAVRIYELLTRIQSLSTTLEGVSVAKQRVVNIIAPQLASLRIGTFIVGPDGAKKREKGELHRRLNYSMFGDLTGYEFWAAFFGNLIMSNNAYAIKRGIIGRNTQLEIVLPGCITYDKSTKMYTVDKVPYPRKQIFHVKTNCMDGIRGIEYEVSTTIFKLQEQAEKLAKKFFENGGHVQRIWKFIGELDEGQADKAKAVLEALMKGSDNWQTNPIVPFGLDYSSEPLNARDSQLLETREHNSKEIASLYGIEDGKLDLQKLYNVVIAPVVENMEQAISKNLLSDHEREKYKIEYIINGRFKGDVKERYSVYKDALQLHTINEIREWEGYPSLGTEYDVVINPNTASAGVNEARQAAAKGGENG